MTEKQVMLTADGLKKMEIELEHLKSVRRREVAERIKQAIEFGDISENSEYEDAKNEQAFIEGKVLTLEKMLRNAKLIDEGDFQMMSVVIGSTVVLRIWKIAARKNIQLLALPRRIRRSVRYPTNLLLARPS